ERHVLLLAHQSAVLAILGVPKANLAGDAGCVVAAAGHEQLAVAGERHRHHPAIVSFENGNVFAVRVVEARGVVPTPGCDALPVGRVRDAFDRDPVTGELRRGVVLHADRLTFLRCRHVEQSDAPILSAGDQLLAVRGQGNGIDRLLEPLDHDAWWDADGRIPFRGPLALDRLGDVPYAGGLVEPGAGEKLAVA